MFDWNLYQLSVANQRHREMLAAAEQRRLIRTLRQQRPRQTMRWLAAVRAGLGRRMQQTVLYGRRANGMQSRPS